MMDPVLLRRSRNKLCTTLGGEGATSTTQTKMKISQTMDKNLTKTVKTLKTSKTFSSAL